MNRSESNFPSESSASTVPPAPSGISGLLSGTGGPAAEFSWQEQFPEIVGRSEAMRAVLSSVFRVAKADCPVLIYGESGTGKELIAAALHRLSNRSTKRFVAINCSAIPESLLETELFGHERGAFTGALAKRSGLLDAAQGGTLFLDEIGDMPASLQTKLLRVLQEKQFTPVGGTEVKQADVRIVAATNINLEQAVRDQRFRLDLYYRLNVIPIELPNLRDRRGDVLDLLRHFLHMYNRVHSSASPRVMSDELLQILEAHDWPGNVRELQNLIERLVITSDQRLITPDRLPASFSNNPLKAPQSTQDDIATKQMPTVPNYLRASGTIYPQSHATLPDQGLDLTNYLENLENSLIVQALERTNNNKNQAAKLLGLNRTTLVERLKKRQIGKDADSK